MIFKIKCPNCEAESSLSMIDSSYYGPYRCWKCRAIYTIQVENDEVKSCEPLSQEEFEEQQAMEALKAKFRKE